MSQTFLLLAALLGLFLIVPAVTWIATGSWSRAKEAAKGYGLVLGIVLYGPLALGCFVAWVMSFQS